MRWVPARHWRPQPLPGWHSQHHLQAALQTANSRALLLARCPHSTCAVRSSSRGGSGSSSSSRGGSNSIGLDMTGMALESFKLVAITKAEAARLGHSYTGTEHVLLGILRHGQLEDKVGIDEEHGETGVPQL